MLWHGDRVWVRWFRVKGVSATKQHLDCAGQAGAQACSGMGLAQAAEICMEGLWPTVLGVDYRQADGKRVSPCPAGWPGAGG